MSIGKNIKKLRLLNGLTQNELAFKLKVSNKTISSWEIDRTEPNMGMIEKLSNYLGCEKSELIGDANETYYINEDTRQIAQEIFKNKELRMLFDAGRNAKAEDLRFVHEMLKRMKEKEQ